MVTNAAGLIVPENRPEKLDPIPPIFTARPYLHCTVRRGAGVHESTTANGLRRQLAEIDRQLVTCATLAQAAWAADCTALAEAHERHYVSLELCRADYRLALASEEAELAELRALRAALDAAEEDRLVSTGVR